MTRDDLEYVWGWANDKLATGEQPPWVWDQYVKLCETLDAMLAAMAANTPAGSPRSFRRQGTYLRLVTNNGSVNRAPRRSRPGA
jgi:hypothetical protein